MGVCKGSSRNTLCLQARQVAPAQSSARLCVPLGWQRHCLWWFTPAATLYMKSPVWHTFISTSPRHVVLSASQCTPEHNIPADIAYGQQLSTHIVMLYTSCLAEAGNCIAASLQAAPSVAVNSDLPAPTSESFHKPACNLMDRTATQSDSTHT